MATRVYEAGPARTYGSAWSTAGSAINEGLGTVLGYYQEYQRQKRFEQQQQQEMRVKAQEMAERAEMNDLQKKRYQAEMDAAQVQNLERMAQLTPEAPEEFTQATTTAVPKMAADLGITDQGEEFAGPAVSEVQVGEKQKTTKTPMRSKKIGNYTAVLDWGGAQARKAKEAAEQADWVTLPEDLTTPNGVTYKAGTKVPPQVATAGGRSAGTVQHIQDPVTGEIWGLDEKTGTFTKSLGKVGVKPTGGGGSEGGAYKPVYDKVAKEDVMANDAMIAKNPARYGPAKKGEGPGGKPLLAGEVNQVRDFVSGMNQLGNLLDEAQGSGTVSWAQTKTPALISQWLGWGTDAKSRQASLDAAKQVIGKALEGGVLRKEDEAKYMKILPVIGDDPVTARNKIRNLVTTMKRDAENFLLILEGAGRDVKGVSDLVRSTGERVQNTVNGGGGARVNPLGMTR